VIAWIEGGLDPAQRLEFETHLAKCPECQAAADALLQQKLRPPPEATAPIKPELEQKKSSGTIARTLSILVIAILILLAGFALGSWIWHLAHR
jgi:anti-sigma factor RsiW